MNTSFCTPTSTIPTGGFPSWNAYQSPWFGHPVSFFNPWNGTPVGGYGYGPNGWWFGNTTGQSFVPGVGFNQGWNVPTGNFGWNVPSIFNGSGWWSPAAHWNTNPWNTNSWNTTPWNSVVGWNAGAFFPQHGTSWGTPVGQWNGAGYPSIGNTYGLPIATNSVPTYSPFATNPWLTPTGFGQFFPTNAGYPVNTSGFAPINSSWNTTPVWNTPWNPATANYTPANTVPVSNTGTTFGYTANGFPTPFGNCVPATAGCTGREAA